MCVRPFAIPAEAGAGGVPVVHGDGTLRGWGELPLEPPNEAPRFKGIASAGFFIGGSGRKGGSGEAAAI